MLSSAPPVPHYYCFTTAAIFHHANETQTKIIHYKNSAVTEKYTDLICVSHYEIQFLFLGTALMPFNTSYWILSSLAYDTKKKVIAQ